MRLLQLATILFLCLIGEILNRIVGIPIPGNILGMILLFILLCLKIIKLEYIESCTNFFNKNLSFFFLPAGVGLMTMAKTLQGHLIPIFFICIGTTVTTIIITGHAVQLFHKIKNHRL